MSGRIRGLEQLMTVLLIDWADRGNGDPMVRLAAARRNSMLTVQTQDRPVDEAADLEAGAMGEALDELFAAARAELESVRSGFQNDSGST